MSKSIQLKYIVYLSSIILFTASCNQQRSMNAKDLTAFIDRPENGLTVGKQSDQFLFKAKWRPLEYDQAKMVLMNKPIKESEKDNSYYISLEVTSRNGENLTKWQSHDGKKFQENIYYLSYTMQSDIQLVDGLDTLDCNSYLFERSYDLTNSSMFNLGFEPKVWSTNSKTLIIDGRFFEIAPIKIKFKENNLSQIPNLKV